MRRLNLGHPIGNLIDHAPKFTRDSSRQRFV